MQLGNSIKLKDNVDAEQDVFLINTIAKYIECVSIMAKRVRKKESFTVKIERVNK